MESKGATLSDVTARRGFGVSRDFLVKGIRAGKLEYREGVVWGNPYTKVLRGELELYIAEQYGADRLSRETNQTELRGVKKEMAAPKKRLAELETRKEKLETAMSQ